MAEAVILDVDGTLVDTNYQHALAWYRALRSFDVTPALWRVHRAVGMGGDKLVAAVAGDAFEAEHGDAARAAWKREFEPMLAEVQPFDGVPALLSDLRSVRFAVVLASSGAPEHVEHYLHLLDARSLAHAWTSSDDVGQTKPAPDLVEVALQRVGKRSAVMIGDSTWDVIAADKAGVQTYAVRTGGFSTQELMDAGARKVYDSIGDLHVDLAATVLRRPTP